MRVIFSDQRSAVTAAAACLVAVAILLLAQGTFPQEIVIVGGSALLAVQLLGVATRVILVVTSALLFLCLPMRRTWRLTGAALLLVLICAGPISLIAIAPDANFLDFQPTAFVTGDLALKVPYVALGIALAARGLGAKPAWLMAAIAVGLTAWDLSIAAPHLDGMWQLWVCAVLCVALTARQRLPGAVLPWVLAWAVITVVPWLWAVVPEIGPALSGQVVADRLRALAWATLDNSAPYLIGPAGYCATLGSMAALWSGRPASPGDIWAAAGLALVYLLAELMWNPDSPLSHAMLWRDIGGALSMAPTAALLYAAAWLYFRWDRG